MEIIIAGDFVVNKSYLIKNISSEVIDLFANSTHRIVNLEAPVTDSTKKIVKTGPCLKANKDSTLKVLKTLNINAVTLANNHILDYGEKGLQDTIQWCKSNNIKVVGAGMNLREASQILYLSSNEGKVGIVNFAENEWSASTNHSAGANPMDTISNIKQIQEAKRNADFVIVIIHGGHEYYNLPSPRMQKQYRFYAEHGADFVVGHHTHCVSGYEVYKGVPIYYSLANFLFTINSPKLDWYIGLILKIEIFDKKLTYNHYIIEQSEKEHKLSLSKNTRILDRINEYNDIIVDENELCHRWEEYITEQMNSYLTLWSPINMIKNRYIRGMLNRLSLRFNTKHGIAYYLNLMRCESHKDMSEEVFKRFLAK